MKQREETLTLGQLAKAAGLARASLLHYESLGLLVPKGRSAAGYRLYGSEEVVRLQTIRRFREAGLSLAVIRTLLDVHMTKTTQEATTPIGLLETRLLNLSSEVERLRAQQRSLARLLATPDFLALQQGIGKDGWVAMLRRAGFSDEDMRNWHREFERESPQEHAAFLRSLGLMPDEVETVLRRSRKV